MTLESQRKKIITGEFVALVKFTLMLTAGGNVRLTTSPIDVSLVSSEKKLADEDLLKLIAGPLPKAAGAPKKKKAAAAAAAPSTDAAASSSK